jgi:hypothetical protein
MSDPIQFEGATPRLAFPLLFSGQAQKEFFVNEALLRADLAVQCVVEGEAQTPPPGPSAGQAWLVGDEPGGLFVGHASAIAGWTGDGWRFVEALDGFRVFDRQSRCCRLYSGSWTLPSAAGEPVGGTTVDEQARAAIVALVATLTEAGVLAPG